MTGVNFPVTVSHRPDLLNGLVHEVVGDRYCCNDRAVEMAFAIRFGRHRPTPVMPSGCGAVLVP
jgi:hypothetical protein